MRSASCASRGPATATTPSTSRRRDTLEIRRFEKTRSLEDAASIFEATMGVLGADGVAHNDPRRAPGPDGRAGVPGEHDEHRGRPDAIPGGHGAADRTQLQHQGGAAHRVPGGRLRRLQPLRRGRVHCAEAGPDHGRRQARSSSGRTTRSYGTTPPRTRSCSSIRAEAERSGKGWRHLGLLRQESNTARRRTSFSRVCQPSPPLRKWVIRSASSWIETRSLSGAFDSSCVRLQRSTMCGTTSLAGRIRAVSSEVNSLVSGSAAIPDRMAASS